jgi:hypothetical protein
MSKRSSAASGAQPYAPRMRDFETIDSELRLVAAFAVRLGSGVVRCRR